MEPEQTGSATVFLLDRLNTRYDDFAFVRKRLLTFLRGVRPDDRIAIYALSDELALLHDFSGNAASLTRALDRYRPDEGIETRSATSKPWNSGLPKVDEGQLGANGKMSELYVEDRVRDTANALISVARHVAGLSGQKNLIWVSESFPVSIGYTLRDQRPGTFPLPPSYRTEIDSAGRALSNANLAVWPIDAHALAALEGPYNAETAPHPSVIQLQTEMPKPDEARAADPAVMDRLAKATGGRVLNNTNDIEGAVRRAIDDSAFTYTLGYYPDHHEWDGEFRQIKIKVKRPGIEMRSRSGYIASPESDPAPKVTVAEVVMRRVESSELGLSFQTERLGDRQVRLHIRVDPSTIRFEQEDGKWVGWLDVLSVQLGADGSELGGHGQTLHFRLSPEAYASVRRDGLRISSTEKIDQSATELRFAARDGTTSAVGSLYILVQSLLGR